MTRIFITFFITIFLSAHLSHAQLIKKTDSLQWLVQQNARLYINPEGKISGYYAVDHSGISIYSSPENKAKNLIETKIYWDEIILLRQLINKMPKEVLLKLYQAKNTSRYPDSLYVFSVPQLKAFDTISHLPQPLKGLKIALDPGHISGDMEIAAYELKFLKLKKDSLAGLNEPINLIEGNLTLATALFLKQQLEEAGAEVMLTRNKPNYSSFGVTYPEWLKKAK